jgi:hypothetical protein
MVTAENEFEGVQYKLDVPLYARVWVQNLIISSRNDGFPLWYQFHWPPQDQGE